MAKLKKTAARKKSAAAEASAQAQAERLSKSLSESAQQIWLAGVGAFARAQAEGTKLFEGLVKEGLNLEQTARKIAGNRADVVRDAVESRVGTAKERAADTWDRLEKVFEDRVQRALVKLGVPGRDDLAALADRVDALTAELRRTPPRVRTRVPQHARRPAQARRRTAPRARSQRPVAARRHPRRPRTFDPRRPPAPTARDRNHRAPAPRPGRGRPLHRRPPLVFLL